MDQRILITGSGGFIGQLLIRSLKAQKLTVYDQRFDVTDKTAVESVMGEYQPTTLVHLASPTDVHACETDPLMAQDCIVQGTQNLLDLFDHGERFIFASSMMVYEEPRQGNHVLTEKSKIIPINVYARAKLNAEASVSAWAQSKERSALILRIFPHTHQSQKGSRFLSRTLNLLRENYSLTLDNSLNQQGRDIGAATDLVSCLEHLVLRDLDSDTFNVSSGQARKLGELARLMAQKFGKSVTFTGEAKPENSYCGSNQKLFEQTGWKPKIISDEELISYYLSENPLP